MTAVDDIYSDLILDLYRHPSNFGKIEGANLEVSGGNPLCGDEVAFTLQIANGKTIEDIKFTGHGCAISRAAESLLTQIVKGKPIGNALKLENKDIFEVLGNVIQTRIKCALLGLVVLKRGLEEFERNPRQKAVITGIKI